MYSIIFRLDKYKYNRVSYNNK